MKRRSRGGRILLAFFFAWTCLACGLEQDISFDEPEAPPPGGPSVAVLWNGSEETVFLDDVDKVLFDGTQVCALWDILLAAGLQEQEILSMLFDFEAEDGFRPTSAGCDPLDGETLASGYLDPGTLNLVWESELGLRGCYWVTETARILGEPG